MERNRFAYAGWLVMVIGAGLVSRTVDSLPAFIAEYAGDTLWALMVFLILGLLIPRGRTDLLAIAALLFAFSVEFSQLYRAEWLNNIRATRIGRLALGSGWVATDLICYTVGIAIGAASEVLLKRRKPPGRN